MSLIKYPLRRLVIISVLHLHCQNHLIFVLKLNIKYHIKELQAHLIFHITLNIFNLYFKFRKHLPIKALFQKHIIRHYQMEPDLSYLISY